MKKKSHKPREIDPGEVEPTDRTFAMASLRKPADARLGEMATVAVQSLRLIERVDDAVYHANRDQPAADDMAVNRARLALGIARDAMAALLLAAIGE